MPLTQWGTEENTTPRHVNASDTWLHMLWEHINTLMSVACSAGDGLCMVVLKCWMCDARPTYLKITSKIDSNPCENRRRKQPQKKLKRLFLFLRLKYPQKVIGYFLTQKMLRVLSSISFAWVQVCHAPPPQTGSFCHA